jgi:DNA polymerase-3 subunit epsilon
MNQLLSLGLKREQIPGGGQQDFSSQAWLRAVMKENAKKQKEKNTMLIELPVIVLDTETTGFRPEHGDEMISLCAILLEGQTEKSRISTHIKSDKTIPEDVKKLTGITEEMLTEAPVLEKVMPQLLSLFGSQLIIGYHISHDIAFINHYLWKTIRRRLSNPSLDLKLIMERLYSGHKFAEFDDALDFYSIHLNSRHTAEGDAEAAVYVWKHILAECEKRSVRTLNDFHRLLV